MRFYAHRGDAVPDRFFEADALRPTLCQGSGGWMRTLGRRWWILCGGLEIGPAGFVPRTVLVQERSRNSAGESVAVGAAGGEAGHYAAGTRGIKVSHFAVWHFFERLCRPSLTSKEPMDFYSIEGSKRPRKNLA